MTAHRTARSPWNAIFGRGIARQPGPDAFSETRRPHRHREARHGEARHGEALSVLDAARHVVQQGWTQGNWYVLQAPDGRRRHVRPTSLIPLERQQIGEACVVGAVVEAAVRQSPRAEHANPAIDALWLALQRPTTSVADPVGPVSSPPLRAARVRDLTLWNDQPGRSKDDVLQLIDRTVARICDTRRNHRDGQFTTSVAGQA